jgi:hypothetical protein
VPAAAVEDKTSFNSSSVIPASFTFFACGFCSAGLNVCDRFSLTPSILPTAITPITDHWLGSVPHPDHHNAGRMDIDHQLIW